jgi:hypothetical protein
MPKKKIWANFQRIIELFTQKIVTKLRDPEKTYSGSRIQRSKKHRIPDPRSGFATLLVKGLGVEHGASCMWTGIRAAGGHLLS